MVSFGTSVYKSPEPNVTGDDDILTDIEEDQSVLSSDTDTDIEDEVPANLTEQIKPLVTKIEPLPLPENDQPAIEYVRTKLVGTKLDYFMQRNKQAWI